MPAHNTVTRLHAHNETRHAISCMDISRSEICSVTTDITVFQSPRLFESRGHPEENDYFSLQLLVYWTARSSVVITSGDWIMIAGMAEWTKAHALNIPEVILPRAARVRSPDKDLHFCYHKYILLPVCSYMQKYQIVYGLLISGRDVAMTINAHKEFNFHFHNKIVLRDLDLFFEGTIFFKC